MAACQPSWKKKRRQAQGSVREFVSRYKGGSRRGHQCPHLAFICIHTHRCTNLNTHTHTRTHTRVRTHAHTHTRTRTRTHAHAYAHTHTHTLMCVHLLLEILSSWDSWVTAYLSPFAPFPTFRDPPIPNTSFLHFQYRI